jgi:hypothetical protein
VLSTAVGGDFWYLVGPGPDGWALEGRFEDDRGSLGTPTWVDGRFCTERSDWTSTCLLPLTPPLTDEPPQEYSFVPERIWAAARAEVCRLTEGGTGAEPDAAPDRC